MFVFAHFLLISCTRFWPNRFAQRAAPIATLPPPNTATLLPRMTGVSASGKLYPWAGLKAVGMARATITNAKSGAKTSAEGFMALQGRFKKILSRMIWKDLDS
ncbi:MAG: hypothetical protein LBJ10_09130 [Clostridiales bacterium]|nr:hypothetical protein [Clostridiales bacterium]